MLWLRLTEQRGRTGGGRGKRRGATIAAAMTQAGIGRGGGGVVVVVVYGAGRLSRTDGDEQRGQPTKIQAKAVVGLNAAGACIRPLSWPGRNVLEEGRRPAGQKSCKGQWYWGGTGGTTMTAARRSKTMRANLSAAMAATKSVKNGKSRGGDAQLGGSLRRRSVQPIPKMGKPRHLTPPL